MEQVDPHYLEAILSVLESHKVTFFKCEQFSVGFVGEEKEDDESEGTSTDVRGFVAPTDDKDEDEDASKRYSRAMGRKMPLLNPPKPPAKKD